MTKPSTLKLQLSYWMPTLLGAGLLLAAAPALAEAPLPAEPIVESMVVLRLQDRRVYLYSGEMLISSYPVAVGTDETPTPQGEFLVGNMVVNPVWQSPWTGEVHEPGPDNSLGVRWIGFADSEAGSFGFHGTPTLDSIGTAASNGCVRMRNEDVTALFAAVTVGTPVIVEP
ncbi:MAG: L,D-transpeptidase [Leptolyngbya foveolarum]|uniref:L,D-transpeptidase n=1 Tax=Leptolyngbya foveolarum TaxID=47253 RepID=A0A2W4U5X7_9CYAN|nr:MAG: L,D-transpeptidase [Leptolyngbya foveolarum]